MNRYPFYTLFIYLFLISGCTYLPKDYGLYQEQVSPWVVEQNNSRLQNVSKLIQAGNGSAAKQEADLINTAGLTSNQMAQFNLLSAQILLSFGEAEKAVSQLAATDSGLLVFNDKIKFYQSQAFAFSLTGNLLEQAKARIELDSLLSTPKERRKNQAAILETLGLLPDATFQQQENLNTEWSGWLSIAKIMALRNQNPAKFNSSLAQWRASYPQHAANLFLADVTNMPEDSGDLPASIAVFLPESGPFLDAAKAIKAGFMAAHSQDNQNNSKPQLHFYNTEKAKLPELYQKAITEGAALVIGPLNKEHIQSLAKNASLTVPVLALNQVPGIHKQNLYQFALSPMDDASEITQRAALDGHKKAVVLVPDNELGKRVANYISDSWRGLNGTILKKQTYAPDQLDFSAIIKNLLGEANNGQSKQQSPDVADVLFVSAYGKEGQLINSQTNLVRKLPVYALPTIYSGIPDPMTDDGLNGIVFCDLPWLFNGAYGGDLSLLSLSNIWRQFPSSYLRLVAMGIDAYHLSSRLTKLGTTTYRGATGNLSLANDNRIKRSLVCAKFMKGRPELIGFSRSPSPVTDNPGAQQNLTAPAIAE